MTFIFVVIGEVCMGLNLIMNLLGSPEAMPELVLGLDMLPGEVKSLDVQFN